MSTQTETASQTIENGFDEEKKTYHLDNPISAYIGLCGVKTKGPAFWFPDSELPEENTCPNCLRLKQAQK